MVSKISHIEAASKEGSRFNPNMSDDERRHFSNLILLCDECHTVIDNNDNESEYPVSLLKEWKKNHETKQSQNALNANPSLLSLAISTIANAELDDNYGKDRNIRSFNIEEKIKHNAIKRNKTLIDEYKVYYKKISTLYGELENQGSFKKEKLLRNIKLIYTKVKGRYIGDSDDPMLLIRANADSIIDDIQEELFKIAKEGHCHEDISVGIAIIMVDAFMRCKILEAPVEK